jgi:hypothetical protein
MKRAVFLFLLMALAVSLSSLALEDKFARDGNVGVGDVMLPPGFADSIACLSCNDGESLIQDYEYADPDPDGDSNDESKIFPPPEGATEDGAERIDKETQAKLNSEYPYDCQACAVECNCSDGICRCRAKVCIRTKTQTIHSI